MSKPLPENCWIPSPKSSTPYLKAHILSYTEETFTYELVDSISSPQTLPISKLIPHYPLENPSGYDNLLDLPFIHSAEILNNIENRYSKHIIHTNVGNSLLILNPNELFPWEYDKTKLELFNNKLKTALISQHFEELNDPHIYCRAALAYFSLVQSKKNQAILIHGIAGSGKTENTKFAMKFLALINKQNNLQEEVSIEEKILSCIPILEAFGNAKTANNPNSSRFGKFIRILIEKNEQKIQGAAISSYLLEKGRVSSHVKQERNYHIFYQLLAGLSNNQKKKYFLDGANTRFTYLIPSKNNNDDEDIFNKNDEEKDNDYFNKLVESFTKMKFSSEELDAIYSILISILYLGNIEFIEDMKDSTKISTDENWLEKLTKVLKLDPKKFLDNLLYKTRIIDKEIIKSPLIKSESIAIRDSLARGMYDQLFNWLVKRLNLTLIPKNDVDESVPLRKSFKELRKSLNNPSCDKLAISLLDIFGFENLQFNGFEQFCINFLSEKLHQLYLNETFRHEFQEESENIMNMKLEFKDNQGLLDLFEKFPLGIFQLLDESTSLASNDDRKLLEKIIKTHKDHPCFIKPKSVLETFTIAHGGGAVEYTITGFRNKNKDEIPKELQETIEESENLLISNIFKGFCGFETEKLLDYKKKFKENPNEKGVLAVRTKSEKFLGAKFRTEIKQLIDELNTYDISFVRCLKSNEKNQPKLFDSNFVYSQLQSLEIIQTAKIRKEGFSYKQRFIVFLKEFGGLIGLYGRKNLEKIFVEESHVLSKCKEILNILDEKDFFIGKNKIMMKYTGVRKLESAIKMKENSKAKLIIMRIKSWKDKKNASFNEKKNVCEKSKEKAAIKIQKFWKRKNLKKKQKKNYAKNLNLSEKELHMIEEEEGTKVEIQEINEYCEEEKKDNHQIKITHDSNDEVSEISENVQKCLENIVKEISEKNENIFPLKNENNNNNEINLENVIANRTDSLATNNPEQAAQNIHEKNDFEEESKDNVHNQKNNLDNNAINLPNQNDQGFSINEADDNNAFKKTISMLTEGNIQEEIQQQTNIIAENSSENKTTTNLLYKNNEGFSNNEVVSDGNAFKKTISMLTEVNIPEEIQQQTKTKDECNEYNNPVLSKTISLIAEVNIPEEIHKQITKEEIKTEVNIPEEINPIKGDFNEKNDFIGNETNILLTKAISLIPEVNIPEEIQREIAKEIKTEKNIPEVINIMIDNLDGKNTLFSNEMNLENNSNIKKTVSLIAENNIPEQINRQLTTELIKTEKNIQENINIINEENKDILSNNDNNVNLKEELCLNPELVSEITKETILKENNTNNLGKNQGADDIGQIEIKPIENWVLKENKQINQEIILNAENTIPNSQENGKTEINTINIVKEQENIENQKGKDFLMKVDNYMENEDKMKEESINKKESLSQINDLKPEIFLSINPENEKLIESSNQKNEILENLQESSKEIQENKPTLLANENTQLLLNSPEEKENKSSNFISELPNSFTFEKSNISSNTSSVLPPIIEIEESHNPQNHLKKPLIVISSAQPAMKNLAHANTVLYKSESLKEEEKSERPSKKSQWQKPNNISPFLAPKVPISARLMNYSYDQKLEAEIEKLSLEKSLRKSLLLSPRQPFEEPVTNETLADALNEFIDEKEIMDSAIKRSKECVDMIENNSRILNQKLEEYQAFMDKENSMLDLFLHVKSMKLHLDMNASPFCSDLMIDINNLDTEFIKKVIASPFNQFCERYLPKRTTWSGKVIPFKDLLIFSQKLNYCLTPLNKENEKKAHKSFKLIFNYLYEKDEEKGILIAHELVSLGFNSNNELRNEIFLQILKQTNKPPDEIILMKACVLLLIFASFFRLSAVFLFAFLQHLYTAIQTNQKADDNQIIRALNKACFMRVLRIFVIGDRKKIPRIEELKIITRVKKIIVQMVLPNNPEYFISIPIESYTTIGEAKMLLLKFLNLLPNQQYYGLFALINRNNELEEVFLDDEDKYMDILNTLETQKEDFEQRVTKGKKKGFNRLWFFDYRIMLKIRVFFKLIDIDIDGLNFYYLQHQGHLINGLYCLSELDLYHLITISFLISFDIKLDNPLETKAIAKLIPKHGYKSYSVNTIMENVRFLLEKYQNIEKKELKKLFLDILRKYDLFMCQCFCVKYIQISQNGEEINKGSMKLALRPLQIFLVDEFSMKTLKSYKFNEIKEWGVDKENYFIMHTEDNLRHICESPQSSWIEYLLKVYSKMALGEIQEKNKNME